MKVEHEEQRRRWKNETERRKRNYYEFCCCSRNCVYFEHSLMLVAYNMQQHTHNQYNWSTQMIFVIWKRELFPINITLLFDKRLAFKKNRRAEHLEPVLFSAFKYGFIQRVQ